ncbi:hypothetical protein [Gottfriedia acidiceleris]|uniref:hypothetical protein n=1 Tax=Gottfriedia acidiceleris TaxID=371036 RepID=UPI000B45389E|nr:hypothetical protein [Gottfriedia acidiceleris]
MQFLPFRFHNHPERRIWQVVDGVWKKSPETQRHYMVRAVVDYETSAPVITSPTNGAYTHNANVTVQGQSVPGVNILIDYNGKEVASV